MDFMMDFINKNKKLVIGGVIGIVAIIIIILILKVCMSSKNNKAELEKSLKEMGADFYENVYYDKVKTNDEERKEFLKGFEKTGIKVDLDNLGRYNGKVNEKVVETFVNSKTKEKCDKNQTKAIIYPVKPYGKKDYKIETEIVCGFDENKK